MKVIIVFIIVALIIFLIYYATKKRVKRIEVFRYNLDVGHYGKIYLYGESSLCDDNWYFVKIVSINLDDHTVGVKYKSEPTHHSIIQPKYPNINRLHPLSKKQQKRLEGTF